MSEIFKKSFFLLVFGFLLVFFLPKTSFSQPDFDVTVILTMDALPSEAKDRLNQLKQQVEDYYTRNKFADIDFENLYKIKLTIQFNFRGTNGFDLYDAQVFVASQRVIDDQYKTTPQMKYTTLFKYLDDKVTFTYNRSMPFIKNDLRFDSFLSLLDYYAYLVLGYDEDSYFPRGGNRYYQKALDLCNKPMTDRSGWTEGGGGKPTRSDLVSEMLNSRFDNFRQGLWEYNWLGLDSLSTNPRNSYKYILAAIEKISNVKKKEVKAYNIDLFFENKSQEIGTIFQNYGDRTVYDKLAKLDPAHQRIYEDFKAKSK